MSVDVVDVVEIFFELCVGFRRSSSVVQLTLPASCTTVQRWTDLRLQAAVLVVRIDNPMRNFVGGRSFRSMLRDLYKCVNGPRITRHMDICMRLPSS